MLKRIHMDGHLGVTKTLQFFHRQFEEVRDKMLCESVLSSCEGCQLRPDYWPRKVPQGQIESTSPWDMLSVDVMGSFVSSKRGEMYILSRTLIF